MACSQAGRSRTLAVARTVVTRSGFRSSAAGVGARAPSDHRVRSATTVGGVPALRRRRMRSDPHSVSAARYAPVLASEDRHAPAFRPSR